MTSRESTRFLPLGASDPATATRRAPFSERAFTWGWGIIQWPWLARSLSGGSPKVKAALLADLGLAPDALPNLGSWKADTGFLSLIVEHVRAARPQTVVELGSGASSLIIGAALRQVGAGGQLISCDQHAGFIDATRDWLREHGIDADMRATPLGPPQPGWPGVWYDLAPLPDRIDMIVIDGPPWTIHPFVRGSAEVLFDRLPVGGTIMLDDAARPGERVVARRWRKAWPDFRFDLVNRGTKGTLIGTRIR